jgi:RHS repeat-associated protein
MVSYQGGAKTGFTKFLRDGAAVVYEKSFTISGSTHTNKSEKTYLYGAGRMAVTKDTTLTGTAVSTYTYYGVDHLGTVRYSKTINSSGVPVSGGLVSYAFEPFGVMIPGQSASISPNGNTHLYTGHERDTLADGSNMDYMHFRFFSASMGRFQKPDSNFDNPTSNPQGWNLYSYVKGNPANFNDPTGHDTNLTPGGGAAPAGVPDNSSANGLLPTEKAKQDIIDANADRHIGNEDPVEYEKAKYGMSTAWQALKDTVVGAGKEVGNTVIGLANTVNAPIDYLLSACGSSFQFGQVEELQASTPGERTAMTTVFAGSFLIGVGEAETARIAEKGTVVIGKMEDLGALKEGERTLVSKLTPDLGSPKANWERNSSVLRSEMKAGNPIRDATVNPKTGALENNTGFLKAERNLLDSKGWTYNPSSTTWNPPNP